MTTGSLVNSFYLNHTSGDLNLTNSNLNVGSGGLLGNQVVLPFGKNVSVSNTVTVASDGLIAMEGGTFIGGTIINAGQINLSGASSTLGGTTLSNSNLITGTGTIEATLNNDPNGLVRAFTAEQLDFTGAGNTNDGVIELLGGAIRFTQDFTNNSGGVVLGNGSLIAEGGLTNDDGTMAFSAVTNIDGDVTNNTFGVIISSGGTTTFLDDVVNNGEIRTSLGSFTVFLGSVSGTAAFTGPGTVLMEGDILPGSSPASDSS